MAPGCRGSKSRVLVDQLLVRTDTPIPWISGKRPGVIFCRAASSVGGLSKSDVRKLAFCRLQREWREASRSDQEQPWALQDPKTYQERLEEPALQTFVPLLFFSSIASRRCMAKPLAHHQVSKLTQVTVSIDVSIGPHTTSSMSG